MRALKLKAFCGAAHDEYVALDEALMQLNEWGRDRNITIQGMKWDAGPPKNLKYTIWARIEIIYEER